MFAKIYTQILDSSLAEDYQTRHVFEDLLKLCDINGVVDITREAIARRTNVPLEIVARGIAELEKPDPRSRNPENDGRRIVRIDDHRDWGWVIVNYDYYRKIASEDQRREKTAARVRNLRAKRKGVTPCNARNADVTPANASNAMQRKMNKDNDKAFSTKGTTKLSDREKFLADSIEQSLGDQWVNDAGKWMNRIKTEIEKADRVIGEVKLAVDEKRIKTTPAQYAEQIWKEFK